MLYENLLEKIGFCDRDIADYNKYFALAGELVEPYSRRLVKTKEAILDLMAELHGATEGIVDKNTADMLFLLLGTSYLSVEYKARGLSDKLFFDTMRDLKTKLDECYACKGIFGCFCADWMAGYFRCERFALGRLQYDFFPFPDNNLRIGDYTVEKGEFVVSCHIPSGSPLLRESYLESYRLAYEFFADKIRPDGILPILCDSWMFHPPLLEVFGKGSNSYEFISDYYIYADKHISDEFREGWRIFNRKVDGDPEDLPNDTRMQRAFIEYMKNGGTFGYTDGVLLFDGENILTKNQYCK